MFSVRMQVCEREVEHTLNMCKDKRSYQEMGS